MEGVYCAKAYYRTAELTDPLYTSAITGLKIIHKLFIVYECHYASSTLGYR